MEAKATFKITGWDEETISELDEGGKLTRAHVGKSYAGALQGQGRVEYVMMYRSDGSADFVGYEQVQATVDGKKGSFVFEHRGYYKDGTANDTWKIVEGSGSKALNGIEGKVHFSESHKEEYEITLQYDL